MTRKAAFWPWFRFYRREGKSIIEAWRLVRSIT